VTKTEVLSFVQQIKPHELEQSVLLRWLDELEKRIALELHGRYLREDTFTASSTEELSVAAPFDKVYWTYLISMIDFVAGDPEIYAFSSGVFKEAYGEYARYVQRNSGSRRKRSR
jgi:hypothetical protein